jgi:hypothetical protein
MKYSDLIQFDSIETIVQLRSANDTATAGQLVSSYVISEQMADRLVGVVIPQLQFHEDKDNKGLMVVGNYGTGKSHLMSVLSAVAEHQNLAEKITNSEVSEAASAIAGQFKVIRTEIGATKRSLRNIICGTLEDELEKMGISFSFPEEDQITNHKTVFEDLMATFSEHYPDQGLLLVIDELLDYLRGRNQQEVVLDLSFLREIGEICKDSRFRFVAGIQEAIFDSPRFQFVSDSLKRVHARFEQLFIAREDIKFVVAERLLKKDIAQEAKIREYLTPFSKFYSNLSQRLDEYVRLFPVHPDYIETFEQVTAVEKREILKGLSRSMGQLLDQTIPEDHPGLIAYDSYWIELNSNKSNKTDPNIGPVMKCSDLLIGRIEQAFTRPLYKPMALRIINALSLHRLTVGDIHAPMGATAKELRDVLCLYHPGIEDLGGDPAEDLLCLVETVMGEIHKTVSGQFISFNADNRQFFIDLKKTDDFDALVDTRAETLSPDECNVAYHKALIQLLECSDLPQSEYPNLWGFEAEWLEHKAYRDGWLFFGTPNERSTAYPPKDFYLYFVQPFDTPKFKDEKQQDEVLLHLKHYDDQFVTVLKRFAAASALSETSSGQAKNTYQDKARDAHREMSDWLRANAMTAYEVSHQGKRKTLNDWFKGHDLRAITGTAPTERIDFREITRAAASVCLAPRFEELAPQYPRFSLLVSKTNRPGYARNALEAIASSMSKTTKQATAVLDALGLLDGDKLAPRTSIYAKHILTALSAKPQGQVLNRAELLIEKNQVDYMAPDSFRLEAEWVVVLLAALVYSGDTVLSITGNKFDASKLDELSRTDVDDLCHFKHLEAPKDWNILGLQELFELLELPPGQVLEITQGKEDVIVKLQTQVSCHVNELVTVIAAIRERIPFWGGHVLSQAEFDQYRDQMTATKEFLEKIQPYNTAGKLKNFKLSADEIIAQQGGLDRYQKLKSLVELVAYLSERANYLQLAEAMLPVEHEWQTKVKDAQTNLVHQLGDSEARVKPNFRRESEKTLGALKADYIHIYSAAYSKARLTPDEDKRKQRLMQDARLNQLQALSTIDILPTSQLSEWRNQLAGLIPQVAIDTKPLQTDPNPLSINFRPVSEDLSISASQRLANLEEKLERMANQWVNSLLDSLDDPVTKANIDILTDTEAKTAISEFVAFKALPETLTPNVIQSLKEILTGLTPITISGEDITAFLFSEGSSAKIGDLEGRFKDFLREKCKGHALDKVRIILK